MLLVLALAGRALADRVRRAGRGPALQRVLGGVMVATAVAMAFQVDVSFQSAIADHLPAAVVNPTKSLEDSKAVAKRLDDLRRPSQFAAAAEQRPDSGLQDYGAAPEFTGNERWFNSRPLTLRQLRGRVVLVDFWTYTCINCLRTLPHLTAWDRAYRDDGLTIVGVHSPEFTFERDAGNVAAAIRREGIRYPVAQDNQHGDLGRLRQPVLAGRVPDRRPRPRPPRPLRRGRLRPDRGGDPRAAARGGRHPGRRVPPDRGFEPAAQTTPETYLGSRAPSATPRRVAPGTRELRADARRTASARASSRSAAAGTSQTRPPRPARTARRSPARSRARTSTSCSARRPAGPGPCGCALDGRPIAAGAAGADVHGSTVNVATQRLYHLVSRPKAETHVLSLRFSRGVAGYAFTFG